MQILPGETLRAYSSQYWECFNLVDDACNDSRAITAFKMRLHPDSALCSSLTRRPPKTVWGLMKKVEEYCKVKDDALRVKAEHIAIKTAPPEIAQPISSVPPQSPEPRQRAKRDKKHDSR
ncbi:hypothetical protein CsSME_00016635 [Camellia sinensis var. sinensis]